MKKNKQNNNTIKNKTNSNITNSNGQNIGFDAKNTDTSKSFKYDENADHSFELRDCK